MTCAAWCGSRVNEVGTRLGSTCELTACQVPPKFVSIPEVNGALPAGVASVAAPARVGHLASVGDGVDRVARAGVVHGDPVAGRGGATGLPPLALVVPDELTAGHPVVDVGDVGAERGDEARVGVAGVRGEDGVEAGRVDRREGVRAPVRHSPVDGGDHIQVHVLGYRLVAVGRVDEDIAAVAALRRDHAAGARPEQAYAVVLQAAPDVDAALPGPAHAHGVILQVVQGRVEVTPLHRADLGDRVCVDA